MLRLFTAIALPDTLTARLATLRAGIPGARWRPPETLHLTLRFIGPVAPAEAAEIDTVLARIAAPGFDLVLDGVGQFGTKRRPALVWAGVRPDPALRFLQTKIDRALVGAGLPPETRNFLPHVTLARLGAGTRAGDRVGRWMQDHAAFLAPPIPVTLFHLMESRPGGDQPVYETLASYALSGGAAAEPHGLPHEEPLDRR